jgi:hypothetical protein
MTYQDEFFTPEEVDTQIERASQLKEGDRTDAEVIAYLRSFYRTDTRQQQEMLDRVWNRIAHATPSEHYEQEHEKEIDMQDRQTQNNRMGRLRPQVPQRPRRTSLVQRLGMLAAAVFLVALVGSMAIVFYAARHTNGGTASPNPTPTLTSTPKTAPAPLKVTSVGMSVTPRSIAGITCGTNLTVTYTAIFHVTPKSAGGTVQFSYTVNNGRGQSIASLNFSPGETTKTYAFTWSGALPADHTYPGPGGIEVTSPNQLISPLVEPTGQCTPAATFHVTNIAMTVSPTSIQGLTCGTSLVVIYTATIHVAPNSPGGTVQFSYTVNNGRGQNMASLNFGPGKTTRTYTFTWSGALPADHTYPEPGGIEVTSPNQLISPLVGPTGMCS